MRRFRIAAAGSLAAMIASLAASPAVSQVPPTPPRDRWYASNEAQVAKGHWGDGTRVRIDEGCVGLAQAEAVECSLEAFKDKPFVVIALVDSGINPYHVDFRAPEFVHHPSTYVEGYPQSAAELRLSLDTADAQGYDAARTRDASKLTGIQNQKLYWIPGTRIIGGISFGSGGAANGLQERRIIDDEGHGTGTASVAAGRFFGSNPNALIVEVEGLGNASVAWAASQPWIDMVSNSWGPGLPGRIDPLTSAAASRDATRRGQSVLFSSGNGMYNTNSSTVFTPGGPVEDPCKCKIPPPNVSSTSYTSGPSWIITVGAASPINGQAHWWYGRPVDVMSFGSKWRAAGVRGIGLDTTTDFGGTSCATPITAGVLSAVIERARTILGDTVAGQKEAGVVAKAAPGIQLPTAGPLADGMLTRLEAEAIVMKTAAPVPFDQERFTWDYAVEPTGPMYYVSQGYGLVDRGSKQRALEVVSGDRALPDRAEVDGWIAAMDATRNGIYGNP